MPLFDWLSSRMSGVLLHPTSLPGRQGIGTFDRHADRFLDFLQAAGIATWQICPLGPTGYGDSPYQCFSSFAGNPYLIDLEDLAARGFLGADDLAPLQALDPDRVDFGAIYERKWPLLRQAYAGFQRAGSPALGAETFAAFKARAAAWLEDYAYFQALKDHHGGKAWTAWPDATRKFASARKSALRTKLAAAIDAQCFYQYVFFTQWTRVRAAAQQRGISLIGDIPIFVAADSADVWSRPELFELNATTGQPLAVAGVPPDYFSADGQLWGNPLYAWKRHAADGYAWWQTRLAAAFELCDILRIDHFRGFDEYWRIPWPAATARVGSWVPGPGLDFFRAMQQRFPAGKIIAEDLGVLTDTVTRLRDDAGLPGMAVLQFAFDDTAKNPYLPHNLVPNSVIYPGTHDNDTTLGWYAGASEYAREPFARYLQVKGDAVGWDFLRASYASVSRLAVIPFQDLLSLGATARFNSPGTPAGNWQWRYRDEQLDALQGGSAAYLRQLGELYGRAPAPPAG